jgi:hypothetical protein
MAMKDRSDAVAMPTGVRTAARKNRHAEQIGEPLRVSPDSAVGQRSAWTKKISQRKARRVSDEVIVALTRWDNITPWEAKDLWTGLTLFTGTAIHDRNGPKGPGAGAWTLISRRESLGMLALSLSLESFDEGRV